MDDSSPTGDAGSTAPAAPSTDPRAARVEEALIESRVSAALFGERVAEVAIGRYWLLERIGAGGMGEVYGAYDPELDRKVALKLVKSSALESSDDVRLYREAQTLARLSHPNVVHVYEVGRCEGQVFLAMELVRGVTLREWLAAADQRRPWRDVLRVFVAAGRGLAAAHAAGLVHRDVKPGNLIIGDDDRVRVIDFGLARVEPGVATAAGDGEPLARALACTETGAVVGTPPYMSPEQFEHADVDHRSDQWSFCVALYEALYGRRPFTGDELAALKEAVTRGDVPPPPRGSAVPSQVWRMLVRGLAVERERRHASMDVLLAALEEVLAPRRRRGAAGVIVLAALALASVAVLRREAADPCSTAGDEIAAVWNHATRTRAHAAIQGTGLAYAASTWRTAQAQIDRYANTWATARVHTCAATRIRGEQTVALYELQTLCLDRRLGQLRSLIAALGSADAGMAEHAVEAVAQLPGPATCLDGEQLRLGVRPPADPGTAARVAQIRENLAEGHALAYLGRYERAVAIADEALRAGAAVDYTPVRAEAMFLAGSARLRRHGDSDGELGRRLLYDAAGLAEGSRHDELAAEIWNELAYRRTWEISDKARLRRWIDRARAAVDRVDDHGVHRAQLLRNSGVLLHREHQYAAAEIELGRAIALAEEHHAAPVTVARYRINLGNALAELGRHDEAQAIYDQARTTLASELGTSHPAVARASFNQGLQASQTGQFRRARLLLVQAAEAFSAIGAADGIDMARVQLALADLDQQTGALASATAHAERALAIYSARYGDGHENLLEPLSTLGVVWFRRRDYEASARFAEQALAVVLGGPGADPDDPNVGLLHNNLGEALLELGRHDQALERFAESARILTPVTGDNPLLGALPRKGRGMALLGQGRARAAIVELEAALLLLREHPGAPLERASTAWALARARRAAGMWPDARTRALAEEALELYQPQGDTAAPERAAIERWLGR